MTVRDRIMGLVNVQSVDLEGDTWEKLVYLAYWIGREEATKEVSDLYRDHLSAQSQRAAQCRYRHMAEKILDNGDGYIYTSDYRQEMTSTFGGDETTF